MSILALLMLVGVASAKFPVSHNNENQLQPIATVSEARRICAELCMSGLGGEPCGESCLDITPPRLPVQYQNNDQDRRNFSRRDACPVLCSNHLGYPLCQCGTGFSASAQKTFQVNYVQICGYYCLNHNYQIYGCQECQVYENVRGRYKNFAQVVFGASSKASRSNLQSIDWEAWCKQQCLVGNGGAACNCDILPFASIKNKV